MITTIIFDFFDVIHRDPYQTWLRENGLQKIKELEESSLLVDLGHISDDEFYQRLSKSTGRDYKDIKAIFMDDNYLDIVILNLIIVLKDSYQIGLLSNSSSEYIRSILNKHDLTELFDEIIVSAEVGIAKPSPEIFMHALSVLDSSPENTVFIDDNINNVKVASDIGIKGILYNGSADELKQELQQLKVLD